MSASLAPECNEAKELVTGLPCRFLRGQAANDECEGLFKQYKQCLTKALKDRGLDTMIDEARQNNKENDEAHMKRG
ncbi:MAG: Mitochondrial distribution and morphology protein 35 [Cirrosporium novae-zelandiae]|nr:MAG: Mitochondrial distribution and morphology protein 35 [Cirrosporium novae-zelandiae]